MPNTLVESALASGGMKMDLDDQKVSNPNPPVQVIKDTLAAIRK